MRLLNLLLVFIIFIYFFSENYDLDPEEKYDKIPEVWNGHNIADFVDTDILDVSN